MEKVKEYTSMDWGKFFRKKGPSWRDKDYKFLISVFNMKGMKGSLLDVGCGLGDGILYLKSRNLNITKFSGVDFSVQAITTCNNNSLLQDCTFFTHNINNEIENKYDNIISLQTIEHVPDPTKAVTNMLKATKDLLVISAPYKNRRPDRNHLWSFDENDFAGLLDFYCLGQNDKNIYWFKDLR